MALILSPVAEADRLQKTSTLKALDARDRISASHVD
jgi:hypothetical protein